MMRRLYTAAITSVLRPYTLRELPGWGYLYRLLVGDYHRDWLWRDQPERWMRGKRHQYEMSLRIGGWANRSAFFLGRFYDLPTQILLEDTLRSNDVVLDVGANEGQVTLVAARRVGPGGKVFSFEPNPVPRQILQRSLERNDIANVIVIPAGLSDEAGSLDLFVPSINSGEGSFAASPDEAGYTVTCPVLVGDALMVEESPVLVKIDVEGFEVRVLKGLSATISRNRPIVLIETIAGHLARDNMSPTDIANFFTPLNYTARRVGLRRKGLRQLLHLDPSVDPWRDGDYVWIPCERISEFAN